MSGSPSHMPHTCEYFQETSPGTLHPVLPQPKDMLFSFLFGVKTLYPDSTMYDCTGTEDQLYPNIGIGMLYLMLGVFFQIVYIPCIIVMNQPPLKSMPCFKVMTYMGVVDVVNLLICADLAGIWQITGQTYCHSLNFAYITGNLAMGKLIYLWLGFPTACFFFFSFFEKPLIYDPRLFTFLFNPNTNVSLHLDPHIYESIPHAINNGALIVSLAAFYPIICGSLAYRVWKNKSSNISSMTKQIILQSMVICGCHIIGCFIYVYMQFFPVPTIFAVIGSLCWILNHGNCNVRSFPRTIAITQLIEVFLGQSTCA
ncbi:hypothetical protein ANCCAN_27236 [Ancylostoma caninum]|uniref:7TM GPCR serpentine receptor class x (Srx) domain-containing protein n=1 Tax=Ancylostoma caninum TaxID=29170 RepID=A0A368F4I1_ANCCA|nr:hypothetical protein ANCCAN_27236 [Ancylostoma caninum]